MNMTAFAIQSLFPVSAAIFFTMLAAQTARYTPKVANESQSISAVFT